MLLQLRENSGSSGNAVKVSLVNFKYQGRHNSPSMPYIRNRNFILPSLLLQLTENSADWVQKDHAKEQKTTHEISFGVVNFKAK